MALLGTSDPLSSQRLLMYMKYIYNTKIQTILSPGLKTARPSMSREVTHEDAEATLRETWREVNERDDIRYVGNSTIYQGLRSVFSSDKYGTRTFKYILLTNVLAKAVNPDVHALALQDQSELDGSFNSGGLATEVVTDWEKDNGERLGGSNEPRTNSVYYRQSKLNRDYEVQSEELYLTLITVLTELQSEVADGAVDPHDVLRQALYEVSRLEVQTIDPDIPPGVSYTTVVTVVREYLRESGTGERLAAITAGLFDVQAFVPGRREVHVRADHVNVADENSDAAGDVEVFETDREEDLLRAAEVKDKPTTKSDVQHSISTAATHGLDEYLYVVGEGFRSESERRKAEAAIEDATIELTLVDVHDLLSSLKFQGRTGRSRFLNGVGEFLNDMRAQQKSKSDWERLVESL